MTQYTRARKARPGFARLAFASLLAMMALAASPDARADEALKAKVGVLRLSSSAPVFIAQDKGYFRRSRSRPRRAISISVSRRSPPGSITSRARAR